MSKDPAFLFYSSDFLTGVADLNMEERGQFITMLCLQHQKGHITEKMMRLQCGGIPSDDVLAKFDKNDNGDLVNKRIELEREKRKQHSLRQSANAKARWDKVKDKNNSDQYATAYATAYAKTMPLENENENEIEIIIDNKNENEKQKTVKAELFPSFDDFWDAYDKKTSRHRSKSLWARIKQSDRELIMAHLEKYIPSTPDKNYRKNADTYLRNKGWEDEVFDNQLNTQKYGNSKTNYSALRSELGIIAGQ